MAGLKVAVTLWPAPTVRLHVLVVPLQAPPQPANMEKVEGAPGASVSVTCAPSVKVAVQVPGQLMPAGELVTVPCAVPPIVTLI